jgi:hypothetical protein
MSEVAESGDVSDELTLASALLTSVDEFSWRPIGCRAMVDYCVRSGTISLLVRIHRDPNAST